MSSLVVLCLSSYYRFVLLPYYELVSLWASVAYVQIILNDVARASPQLVPSSVSHVCHHSRPELFLCGHKSIIACASQLHLVVGHVVLWTLSSARFISARNQSEIESQPDYVI
jgi:hypothetical protein